MKRRGPLLLVQHEALVRRVRGGVVRDDRGEHALLPLGLRVLFLDALTEAVDGLIVLELILVRRGREWVVILLHRQRLWRRRGGGRGEDDELRAA